MQCEFDAERPKRREKLEQEMEVNIIIQEPKDYLTSSLNIDISYKVILHEILSFNLYFNLVNSLNCLQL